MPRIGVTLVLLLCGSVAWSQETLQMRAQRAIELMEPVERAVLLQEFERPLIDPTLTLKSASVNPVLKYSASSANKLASLRIGGAFSSRFPKWEWHVQVNTPLSEDDARTEVLSVKGFGNSPSGEVGLIWSSKKAAARKSAEAIRVALDQLRAGRLDPSPANRSELPAAQRAAIEILHFSDRAVLRSAAFGPEEAARSLDRGLAAALERADFTADDPAWFASSTIKLARKAYKFAQLLDRSEASQTKTGSEFEVSGGRYWPRWKFYAGVSTALSTKYKDANKRTFCRELPDTTDLECSTLPFGAPDEQDGHLGSLEIQKLFARNFGMHPVFSRDFKRNSNTLEIPVYFIQKPDNGGLHGGISLDWNSEDDNWSLGVFVGAFADVPAPLRRQK